MSVTVLNPHQHLVRETPAAQFFRRRLRDPDMMTFWNQSTGQWILAYWLHKTLRIVDEIEDLGARFENMTQGFIEMIVGCYGPVDLKKTKRRLLEKNRSNIRKQTEDILDQQEKWDWLKKKMSRPFPYMFSSPVSGGQVGPAKEVG